MDQFVDDYLASMYEERQRDNRRQWVKDKMAADFIEQSWPHWYATWAAVVLTSLVLAEHVDLKYLLAWIFLAIVLQIHRRWLVMKFERAREAKTAKNLLMNDEAFFQRYRWSWAACAVLVAMPMFAFYEQVPPANQLLCVAMLIGLGATASVHMAARPDCLRLFTCMLVLTVLCAVLWQSLRYEVSASRLSTLVFIALFVLFGVFVLRMGGSLYTAQYASYEANFDNQQLITSLRQQTQTALQAVQLKSNLLASATHDLAQPLHALSFYTELLRNDPGTAEQVLPKILQSSQSVNALFFSLFDFARIESGAVQIKRESVELVRLLGDVSSQYEPAARSKNLQIRVHFPREKIGLTSDTVHLRRIISNLVGNAVRYTEKGGVLIAVRFFGRDRDKRLCVEIWDSGVGIAAEDLPHVFKEFFRAPGHEGSADSFGLGLAIVQKLCRALEIEIQLDSRKAKGTRCRLIFPLEKNSNHAT